MNALPVYLSPAFGCLAVFTLYCLYKAAPSKTLLLVCAGWLILQSGIALTGFYTDTQTLPPRLFLFVLWPALLCIAVLFMTRRGKTWIDTLNIGWLTYLHLVRLPVELVLFVLYTHGAVPELMTFEGSNPDILSGISAAVIGYWGYSKRVFGKKILLTWNLVCLAFLLNIVIHAILASPFPFQQLAFVQPNIAIFYFPYVLLPGFIVPVVLFAHLVAIRNLLR